MTVAVLSQFFFQCTAILCFQAFGHPPPIVVAVLKFSLVWTCSLVQWSLVSLSIIRMFLILKVISVSFLSWSFFHILFFQPAEFTQLEHEKRFKFVLKCLFILITVYVALFFLLADIIDPRAPFVRVSSFTDGLLVELEGSMTKVFVLFSNGMTGLAMLIVEICAYVKRPTSTVHPICSAGFIVNNIPFFTLNFSIFLIIVVQVVTGVFFGFLLPFWFNVSAAITSLLMTNKGAGSFVASRLRQQIDTSIIGGSSTIHPVVVSVVFLPPQSQTAADVPTLFQHQSRSLCPVE